MRSHLEILSISTCAIVTALATLGLTGRLIQSLGLTETPTAFHSVHFTTACSFLLCGCALYFLIKNRLSTSSVIALLVLLVGCASLYAYTADIPLGIDKLLLGSIATSDPYAPASMTAYSATNFMLTAVAILLLTSLPTYRISIFLTTIFASIIFGSGVMGLLSYTNGLIPLHSWGSMIQMELPNSFGFTAVGIILLLHTYQIYEQRKENHNWVLPAFTPFAIAMASLLHLAVAVERENELEQIITNEVNAFQYEFDLTLQEVNNAIDRMGKRWLGKYYNSEARWRDDAQAYLSDFTFFKAIAWIDKHKNLRWHEVSTPQKGLTQSIRESLVSIGNPPNGRLIQRSNSTYLLHQLRNNGRLDGWIYTRLDLQKLIEPLAIRIEKNGLEVTTSSPEYLFENPTPYNPLRQATLFVKTYTLPNTSTRLVFTPTKQFFNTYDSTVYTIVEYLIIALLFLLLWLTQQFLKVRTQENTILNLHNKQSIALNTMMDGLIIISKDGIINECNQSSLNIFKIDKDTLINQNITKLLPEFFDDRSPPPGSAQTPHAPEFHLGRKRTIKGKKRNGELFPIALQVAQGDFHGEPFYTCVIHDLSDIVKSEQQLEEKELLLNKAINASTIGIFMIDTSGHIVDSNAAFHNWLGYHKEALLGMHILDCVPSALKPFLNETITKLYRGEIEKVKEEQLFLRKKGDPVWGLLSATAIPDTSGNVSFYLLNVVDIQHEKQMSMELEARNRSLEASYAELDQFSYIASHDLKEPIRTLRTFTSYLLKDLEKNDAARIQEDVSFIQDASARMAQLIDDLLLLSRAGNAESTLAELNVTVIITEILTQLSTLVEETNAVIHIADPLPSIVANYSQTSQVFQNLISNAIKFHRPGVAPVVSIDYPEEQQPGYTCITVTDNGIGIPSEHVEKIFCAFKRLHTNADYKGTGIGLAIVKKVLERNGGYVQVDSSIDQGTTFKLFFRNQ